MAASAAEPLVLWAAPTCPYAQRAVLALTESKVSFE